MIGTSGQWEPDSPALRGEGRKDVADGFSPLHPPLLDELPHSQRRELGLDTDEPDPGYDPDGDDDAQAPVAAQEYRPGLGAPDGTGGAA